MVLSKRYIPSEAEPRLQSFWQREGIYNFSPRSEKPVYSIDSPPPTVSGNLHLGHMFSYTQTDIIARYRRMRGDNVFYPMGYDDNGLPTERLVEKLLGVNGGQIERRRCVSMCLEVSQEYEKEYESLWRRRGLSIDWHYTYRSIDDRSQRIAQWSFVDLFQKNLVYRQRAPSIWCSECQTAVAQADLDDLERESELAEINHLPVDPTIDRPGASCPRGSDELLPEEDIITRTEAIEVVDALDPALQVLEIEGPVRIAMVPQDDAG